MGSIKGEAAPVSFNIVVTPASNAGEELFLVCLVEHPKTTVSIPETDTPADTSRVAELEREFEVTRVELQAAVRHLETTSAEQAVIYEEAVSVNEEYQSKNEELMASKEVLQSLNEELNALNSLLQETLERQRTTANDLQNALYRTDVATIFLDSRFNIRFFTPATKALFNVIPGDVGRPLTDLKLLAPDVDLLSYAQTAPDSQTPIEREVAGQGGAWFMPRILPLDVGFGGRP